MDGGSLDYAHYARPHPTNLRRAAQVVSSVLHADHVPVVRRCSALAISPMIRILDLGPIHRRNFCKGARYCW
jgi:hypothetical protein